MWDPLAALDDRQRLLLEEFEEQLRAINQQFNLVSREDEDHLFERHIQHSLALTTRGFPDGADVVDWGTGGGLPLIPLAIAFPNVHFVGVDAVGKKVRAVQTMIRRLELRNAEAWHGRAEEYPGGATHSVSRATAPLRDLWQWHVRIREAGAAGGQFWKPGLICLKGGNLGREIAEVRVRYPNVEVVQQALGWIVSAPYYEEKAIVECFERGA